MSQVLTVLEINPTTTQAEAQITTPRSDRQPSLTNRLQGALEHARRLTAMYQEGQVEIAIAWENVEELQKAQANFPQLSGFEQYCLENPDAPESRIYDV
ncbi:MAG: CP12 domain-containing protein [Prochlorotrichaceae cyanobacterium]|jgi:hypothetical protein